MRKFITYSDRVLPVHLPRVLVETARGLGASPDGLLENTELTAEMLGNPHMRISYGQYGVLIANALRLTRVPSLGLHVGRNTGIAQMGALGFLLQNSPTVGAALGQTLRYCRVVAPGWDLRLERTADAAALVMEEAIATGPFSRFAHEMTLVAFDNQARALHGGKPLPVQAMHLPYEEPEYAGEYRAFYDVPIRFEAPVAKVIFDAALLDQPIPFADPATARLAEEFCARFMPLEGAEDGLVAQVRRALATEFGRPPALPEVARALRTSTRTLRRELSSMGTSYKELLDEMRQRRAEVWMQTSSLSIEQLASDLGFATAGSFRRAYKRWTGEVPSARRGR